MSSFRTESQGKQCRSRSDRGLHCLPFRLHLFDELMVKPTTLFSFFSNFSINGKGMRPTVKTISHFMQKNFRVEWHTISFWREWKLPRIQCKILWISVKISIKTLGSEGWRWARAWQHSFVLEDFCTERTHIIKTVFNFSLYYRF